jgi:hypothetical protein
MQQKKIILFVLVVVFSFHNTFSQSLPDSTIVKINHIFSKWDSKMSPGCVVGITKNDSLIFTKGYGMANLEYDIGMSIQHYFKRSWPHMDQQQIQ